MLSAEDIKKITDAQVEAQTDLFYTKPEMDVKFSNVLSAVDAVMKDKVIKDQEMTIGAYRLKKVEDWIDKAAPKICLKFEH